MTHIVFSCRLMELVTVFSPLLKKSMSVCNASSREATYFPNRYFRRMVVSFMVNNHQLVMKNKFMALMSTYGIEVEESQARGWTPPLLYRQYLHLLLQRDFWGNEVVLFVVSCMWSVKITVLNMKTLQEYQIQHDMGHGGCRHGRYLQWEQPFQCCW